MRTKICTKCNKELLVDNFGALARSKDSLTTWCKGCLKEYRDTNKDRVNKERKKYRVENKIKVNEDRKKYRIENKTKIAQWGKNHRENHKEQIIGEHKKYYEENKEMITEHKKKYYAGNKEKILEHSKKYYGINKQILSDKRKKYYEENKEQTAKTMQKYAKDNKDKFVLYNQNRRAKKLQLPSTLTRKQWVMIRIHFNNCCCYCGRELPLAQEHFISLNKGGEYTVNNIVCACKNCNSSKGNRDFHKWYKKYKYYSIEREKAILEYLGCKEEW